jgi:D-methionine transport system substrate-binding protein
VINEEAACCFAAVAAFSAHAETLTVAATPVPHAEILNFVKPPWPKKAWS